MEPTLDNIDRLITRAKRFRDKERYEEAIALLERDALPLIMESLSSGSPIDKYELGRRLADCYGLQGGCYRRWGLEKQDVVERNDLLTKSVEKYREGEQIESNGEYRITSTYNLLNRIISQILLDPRFLSDPPSIAGNSESRSIDAKKELEKVKQEMEKQVHRDDSWFLADKALVNLLLDKNNLDPKEIYSPFLNPERIHPYFVYESMLSTLVPLAELDLPIAAKLRETVQQLEDRRKQLQQ